MPDISSVSSEIQRLENSYLWWSSVAVWLTALTAIVAALYFVAAFVANRKGIHLNEARKQESLLREQQRRAEKEEADREIARANESAAKANQAAEVLKNENLAIQRRLADRFLSGGEKKIIADAILPYPGRKIFVNKANTTEAGNYATEIFSLFRNARWEVIPLDEGLLSPEPAGLILRISTRPDAAVQALTSALRRAGMRLTDVRYEHLGPEYVFLLVGVKPPP